MGILAVYFNTHYPTTNNILLVELYNSQAWLPDTFVVQLGDVILFAFSRKTISKNYSFVFFWNKSTSLS